MTLDVISRVSTDAAAHPAQLCFHCGLPVPNDSRYRVTIEGVAQPMCCVGCAAVAQTIVDHGLISYYRHRTQMPAPTEVVPAILEELRRFDLPEIQQGFVATEGEHVREAALLLEGMTCGACVWLIERRVAQQPGVLTAQVNYATQRLRVRWDEQQVALSSILGAVFALGYRATPYDSTRSEQARQYARKIALRRLLIAGFSMMQVMMYVIPSYMNAGEIEPDMLQLLHFASLIMTLPTVLYSAVPFFTGAWRDLAARQVGMDVPVALGILVAFIASVIATLRGSGVVYFDSVAMFVFLLLGARFLEMSARAEAASAHELLLKLVPAVTERLTDYPEGNSVEQVAVASLQVGNHVRVRPGATIPVDGVIVDGSTEVNEAMLTGESRPLARSIGDRVTGGTLNATGPLVLRVEQVGAGTVIAAILRLLDRASMEKPRIARLADRVARGFVAVLLVAAAVVAFVWYGIDPARVLPITIAMLVVSCPCALALATPAAMTAAAGTLYRSGMLVTRGHALETLAAATDFVFDKTGTLTHGSMTLVEVVPLNTLNREQCMTLAAQLEAGSEHPIAHALVAAAGAFSAVPEVTNHPGRGIEATVEGRHYRIGHPEFVAALTPQALPQSLAGISDDVTVIALGDATRWLALFTFSDPLRPHADAVIRDLQGLGKRVHLVSGDRPQIVAHVAQGLGIEVARGGVLPADKLAYVQQLQQSGAVVAAVGDGINDAAALAAAQVSIAMGSGADVAHSSADMVLMSGRLEALFDAVKTARTTLRVIRQNLWWALAYNAVALPLAATGQVTPLIASVGMAASSLLVVLNALRLARSPLNIPA